MIIVSGRLYVAAESRARFLDASVVAVAAARSTAGCRDFVVAADPLDPERVNVYEEWDSAEELESFRGDGPGEDMSALILRADVARHQVASTGPA